jgi:hypothetical protein
MISNITPRLYVRRKRSSKGEWEWVMQSSLEGYIRTVNRIVYKRRDQGRASHANREGGESIWRDEEGNGKMERKVVDVRFR